MCIRTYAQFKTQQGIVLFIVLLMMQLLALFSWFAVQAVQLEQKTIRQRFERQKLQNMSEAILLQIENSLTNSLPECVVPMMPTQQLMSKPLSWWQSFGSCAGNFHAFQYYYVVESLGHDACATLVNLHTAVDYYRITLFMLRKSKIYLQSTVIQASRDTLPCEGRSHAVGLGRQSWRQLKG